MINTSQDENTYSDYDDRPIRPMDQDALNEALARLPILVDEDELSNHSEPNSRYCLADEQHECICLYMF